MTAPGTVLAVATVPVSSPVSGTVARLYADVNEVVKRGQRLAQLDGTRATIRAPIAGVIVSRTVSIEVARRDGVLRLPLAALCFVPPGMEPATPTEPHVGRVFVLDHGRPRPVRVTIGLQDPRHAELVAGPLREGDAVIVERE